MNYRLSGGSLKYVVIFLRTTLFPILSCDMIWHSHIDFKSRQL